MPRLHFIVRFDSSSSVKPTYRATDISITGLPAALEYDETRLFDTHTVIDGEVPGGPWTYRVAIEIAKEANKGLHIVYGTSDRNDAVQRLQSISKWIPEGKEERQRSYEAINHYLEERKRDIEDENFEAQVLSSSQTCVKIKLRKRSFCWYELVSADVADRDKVDTKETTDLNRSEEQERRRKEVEDVVGEDMDIFDDEEEM
jgi:hypothetical protein